MQEEYEAVQSVGLFEIVLFDYHKWIGEGKLVVKNSPKELRHAIYRGWMMKPEQYERLYQLLLEKISNW